MQASHAVKIVAPWYDWASPSSARSSAPVLQMYDTPDLVNAFLRDPTDFLARSAEDALLSSLDANVKVQKVYLGAHQRFYLVVCELHCDVALFPAAARDQVLEAKFVVRRRGQLSREDRATLKRLGAQIDRGIATIGQEITGYRPFQGRTDAPAGVKQKAFLDGRVKQRRYEQLRQQALADLLAQLRSPSGTKNPSADGDELRVVEQAWQGEAGGVGTWVPTVGEPPELFELTYPLYPLVPDPRDPNHPARGRTIYFGLLPTGAREVDARDQPRYDDRSDYVVRCVIRRPSACCDPNDAASCRGTLAWSPPSAAYRLAGFFDVQGHAHRAVSITLPRLADLKAMAPPDTDPKPPWKVDGAGLRVESRDPDLDTAFKGAASGAISPDSETDENGNAITAGATCVYAIPLLMIVANFVFKIFLAILLIVAPVLAFLAQLKICFPTGALPVRTSRSAKAASPDPANAELT